MSYRNRTVAYHEAGHAVIGRVLTLPCGRATIRADRDSAGHSICPDIYACIHEWGRRGKVRSDTAAWHARIIYFMAGAESETELLCVKPHGDSDDRYQIELMLEREIAPADLGRIETRLRAMTRVLVRRHRARIERVASALLTKTRLSAREIDRLAGRSIADVKCNAPFLLAMHREQQKDPGG
jgi:hypothetical protein